MTPNLRVVSKASPVLSWVLRSWTLKGVFSKKRSLEKDFYGGGVGGVGGRESGPPTSSRETLYEGHHLSYLEGYPCPGISSGDPVLPLRPRWTPGPFPPPASCPCVLPPPTPGQVVREGRVRQDPGPRRTTEVLRRSHPTRPNPGPTV